MLTQRKIIRAGRRSVAAPPKTLAYVTTRQEAALTTSHTLFSVDIGAASADRYIVVALAGYSETESTITSTVDLGGISCNLAVGYFTDAYGVRMFSRLYITSAPIPTQTTAMLTVTTNLTTGIGVALYRLTGLTSPTAFGTSVGSGGEVNLNTTAGDLIICLCSTLNDGGAGAIDWSSASGGLTENMDLQLGASWLQFSSASTSSPGNPVHASAWGGTEAAVLAGWR